MSFDYHGIYGFDISTWQDAPSIVGNVNFDKMRAYGARFCIIRASDGNTYDVDFTTNWRNVKGVLPRATYHYYRNQIDPKVQAARYWNTVKDDPDGMFWFDLEDATQGTYAGWQNWYNCIEEFKRLSGVGDNRIGIYTGFYYWIEQTTHATNAQKAWFGKFPLWLAWYFDDPFHPIYITVRIPYPWSKISILQSGTPAIGPLVGVESQEIDYNHFNGTETEFQQLFGSVADVPPPGEPSMAFYKVTAAELNVRSTGVFVADGSNVIGKLLRDDIVQSDTSVNGWRIIQAIYRNNVPVALPASPTGAVWASGAYMVATVYTPPAPPAAGLPDVLWIGETRETVQEYRKAA